MMFSIIIPAYNASKTITRCMNSIISQEYSDFEVLIINDGSIDNTAELIEDYLTKDERVKSITIDNSGVSKARNIGIQKSSGQYLIFIDSDDWILPGYFEYLSIELSENLCGIILPYHEARSNSLSLVNSYKKTCDFESDFLLGKIKNNPWDKVFKRSLYLDNKLSFPEGFCVGEDAYVSLSLLKVSKNIKLGLKGFLIYQLDTGGVSKSPISQKKINDICKISKLISTCVAEKNITLFNYYNIILLIGYYLDACRENDCNIFELERVLERSIKNAKLNKCHSSKINLYLFFLKSAVSFNLLRYMHYFKK
jgi:glycosyltransferase involved in cell wall biosynthesis